MNWNALIENARIAWLLGIRSHAIRAVLVLGALLLGGAFLAGAFSLRQPLVVTLDIGLSGIRLLVMLLILFWMQETFVKDIEKRTITLAFSLPAARVSYVVGRFAGVMGLLLVAIALWGGALFVADQFASWGYAQSSRPTFGLGYLVVLLGIALDAMVIGAFVLAVASVSETPLLPFLSGAAFAFAARSIGPVVDYLEFSSRADPSLRENMLPLLQKVRWVIPDLSRLDVRTIVLYDVWPQGSALLSAAMLSLGYLVAMLAIATYAYDRREFA